MTSIHKAPNNQYFVSAYIMTNQVMKQANVVRKDNIIHSVNIFMVCFWIGGRGQLNMHSCENAENYG